MRALGMLVIISVITIACGLIIFSRPSGSEGSAGLSERGREFLKSQSADGTSTLRTDRIDDAPKSESEHAYETACFRVRLLDDISMQIVDVPGCHVLGKRAAASARLGIETHKGVLDDDASVALRFRSSAYHEVEHTKMRRVYTSDRDATLFEQRGVMVLTVSFSEVAIDPIQLVPDLMTLAEHIEML